MILLYIKLIKIVIVYEAMNIHALYELALVGKDIRRVRLIALSTTVTRIYSREDVILK